MPRKKKLFGFAAEWENIPRVRARFRKQTAWIKIAKNDEGDDVVRSTKTLSMNAEVICAMLYVKGISKVPVAPLRKEAWESLYNPNP